MLEATHLILVALYYAPSYFVIYKSLRALEMERFFVTFARKDNSLRINRLVGLLEKWVTR